MKKMYFSKLNSGEIKVKVENSSGLRADGSTMNISDDVLNQALKEGLFQERAFARGIDNIYYRYGNTTFLRVQSGQVILIDSYLADKNDDEWDFYEYDDTLQGVWLAKIFSKKSVAIKRSDGTKFSRGIPRMSISQVTKNGYRLDMYGNKIRCPEVAKTHPVELSTVIIALNEGRIGTNLSYLSIFNMELHHMEYDWDNRMNCTQFLTSKEHNELHSLMGEQSHQCAVTIRTLDELKAFIKYMNLK